MHIAVIGAGISGLGCAHGLKKTGHEIEIFEARERIGGHTATIDASVESGDYAIDTGFIVYNDWTYPNFMNLVNELGVPSQRTSMGFSVTDELSGLEYAGNNLNALFAQRRNLLSPQFLGMVLDILRFNRLAITDLNTDKLHSEETLGNYLERNQFGEAFCRNYLLSMTSAIWSASASGAYDIPAKFFIQFFRNHGLLSLANKPNWRVIAGGSRNYLKPLTQGFVSSIKTKTPVISISRPLKNRPFLTLNDGSSYSFDKIVIATHSDQALEMLSDADPVEKSVLSAIPYGKNEVVLHTDDRLLPTNRRAWSSWNYRLLTKSEKATLTYNMNILQGIKSPETFCVTLNHSNEINPEKVLGKFSYSHPQFTVDSIKAQKRWKEINGPRHTYFCGAYWGNGFHEDGLSSALHVVSQLNGFTK